MSWRLSSIASASRAADLPRGARSALWCIGDKIAT